MAIVGQGKYTHALAKFRGDPTQRERVCISLALEWPLPKLETTHSLQCIEKQFDLEEGVIYWKTN